MRRLLVALLVLALTAVAPPGPAMAQPSPCPPAMPVSEIETAASGPAGFPASGLTVSRGTAPEPFDVTVLGVLKGGIAPGVDMVIVETESPAIDRAGGIWAGMSGSPVYAADGRLLGAVAYGLAFGPSKLGGLSAAEDMYRVGALGSSAAAALPTALQHELVATGEASARQAAGGLRRLPMPLSVAGLGAGRISALAGRLGRLGRVIPYAAGALAAPAAPAEIVPGGNFAAALSYGDVTAAGVGTTTAVCDSGVLAFGHPMVFQGPSALSAHAASAITVQDDPTLFPFKLANVGTVPLGTVDQDRLSAIRARFGATPVPIPVTSRVADRDTGASRAGTTNVNQTTDVPGIASFGHLLANLDRVIDRIGGGTATLSWTATGTAGGEHFSLSRNNRFADTFDISFASIFELFEQLATLTDNPFKQVTLRSVEIDAEVATPVRQYLIAGLERREGDQWKPFKPGAPLMVAPGSVLRLRVLLDAYRAPAPPPLELSLTIPADAAGQEGFISVSGGGSQGEGEGEGGPPPPGPSPGDSPRSFDELIASLRNAPRNDEIVAQLLLAGPEGAGDPVASVRTRMAEVVAGFAEAVVLVEGGEMPPEELFPPLEEPGGEPGALELLGPPARKLARALRRGIRFTVATGAPGRLVLRALVDRRTARRLGIKRKAKRAVVVGSLARQLDAGRTRVTLRLTKRARSRLADVRRVKLRIVASFTDEAGNRGVQRSAVTLKRRL